MGEREGERRSRTCHFWWACEQYAGMSIPKDVNIILPEVAKGGEVAGQFGDGREELMSGRLVSYH